MFSLILVVISIGLAAAMVLLTVNMAPMDAYQRAILQKESVVGIQSLEKTVTRYLDSNRDAEGNIVYPGDGIDLRNVVTPTFGYLPADTREKMTWALRTGTVKGAPSVGICLYPSIEYGSSAIQKETLLRVQRSLPVEATAVANGCWSDVNQADGNAITYWVPLAHVN